MNQARPDANKSSLRLAPKLRHSLHLQKNPDKNLNMHAISLYLPNHTNDDDINHLIQTLNTVYQNWLRLHDNHTTDYDSLQNLATAFLPNPTQLNIESYLLDNVSSTKNMASSNHMSSHVTMADAATNLTKNVHPKHYVRSKKKSTKGRHQC